MTKRALIYARVSYDDRGNEARNLEGQIEDGRAYTQNKGYRIVAELAEDDRGASGADWNLPMLNQALDMARAGEFDVFVTRELDRFARNLAKQLVIEGEFKRYGVEVEYILGEYPDTPEGNLNKNIKAVIAEYERLKIEERMTRGRRNVVKNGKVMLHGDKPPYGYRLEDGVLVIYEPEARIIRLVFQWYVYGDGNGKKWGIRAIANRLTKMKVPTWADIHGVIKKTRKQGEWNHGAVADILANEVYIGVWHYGKTTRSREGWLAVEVPAIISCELWEKAQERRKHNKEMASRRTKNEYLLRRRVTCQCGTKMSGRASPWKDKNYLYYCCPATSGRIAGCQCDTKYFNADQVDKAVWDWLRNLLIEPGQLRKRLEKQRAEMKLANQRLHDRLAVIDDLLSDNRRQLERLLDLYLSGDFGKEMLTDRKARLETTITGLEKERADLVITLEARVISDEQIREIEELAAFLDIAAADWVFEKRRRLVDDLDVRGNADH